MTTTESNNQITIERPQWLGEEAWPYHVRTAVVDGAPLAYTDEGSGPALLLIHDGMCSYLWVHLVGLLRSDFRVITLDFPGSGLSPASNGPVSLELDSALLGQFIDQIELSDLTLVAHDLGGPVGLGWAVRHPESIESLVLVNTFGWPPRSAPLRAMLGLMGSSPMAALNSATNVLARASSSKFGVGRHFDAEQRRAYVHMFDHKVSRRRFHRLMASAVRETEYMAELEERLGALAGKPVLTVFGQRNDPFGFQERWSTHFPGAEHLVIPGGYHFPMCDAPRTVADGIHQLTN